MIVDLSKGLLWQQKNYQSVSSLFVSRAKMLSYLSLLGRLEGLLRRSSWKSLRGSVGVMNR